MNKIIEIINDKKVYEYIVKLLDEQDRLISLRKYELEINTNDDSTVKAICAKDIFKDLRHKIKVLLVDIPITQSYQSLLFKYVFNLNPNTKSNTDRDKHGLINGSHPDTRLHLKYGLKYQMISTHEIILDNYPNINVKDFGMISLLYLLKLSQCINNGITYNCIDSYTNQPTRIYNPICRKDLMNIINEVYDELFKKNDYTIYTLNNSYYTLDIKYKKQSCIKTMRRFEEPEMVKIVNNLTETLNTKPSISQITDYINESINIDDYEDVEKFLAMRVSQRMVRHYIEIYGLKDKTNQRVRRTNKEIKEQKLNDEKI